MRKYFYILKKCPIFEGIEDEELNRMLVCLGTKVVEYGKRQAIFSEGTAPTYIGVMLEGAGHVEQVDYYGNRSILEKIGVGDVFAEAFACAEVDLLPIDIIADAPSVVMLIDCSHILRTCEKHCAHHQQLIYNLMRNIANKTIVYHQKMEITSKRTTREKILAYLTLMSKKRGSNRFEIPFNRQELADYLEVERSGLSAEISKMKNDGIINNRKNYFELL